MGVGGPTLMVGMGDDTFVAEEGDEGMTTRRVGAGYFLALWGSCDVVPGRTVAECEDAYADPRCSASCHRMDMSLLA